MIARTGRRCTSHGFYGLLNKAVQLRTERLLLSPFTMDDVEDVLEHIDGPEWGPTDIEEENSGSTNDGWHVWETLLNS